MNDHGHEEQDVSPQPSSPNPSMHLYEQTSESKRNHSVSTVSRTKLPPGTPMEERQGVERLRQRMKFDDSESQLVEEVPLAIHVSPDNDGEVEASKATATTASSTEVDGDDTTQLVDGEQATVEGEQGTVEGEQESVEDAAEREAVIHVLLTRLKESDDLLCKACAIRDGMHQVQEGGGDVDESQLQRLDSMIEQLSQERQKYRILLAKQLPDETEREAAQQEQEARELAALQEQKELLMKLVDQQKKLRALEQKQAALLSLQQTASSRLQEANEMRAGLEARAAAAKRGDDEMGEDDDKDEEDEEEDNSEDEDEEEEAKEEEYSDKENDNTDNSQGRKWRKRLHVLEKKQEWMEKLLQRLFVKYSDDRASREEEDYESLQQQDKPLTLNERLQLNDISSQIMQIRSLVKQVEVVQDEAESAAVAAGALPGESDHVEEVTEDPEEQAHVSDEDVEADLASLDFLLTAEIDDPELKEQIRQLQERRTRIEELQRELDRSKAEEEPSANAESVDKDDYVDMSSWERESIETKLRKLEVAKIKLSNLQEIAKQVHEQTVELSVQRSDNSDTDIEVIGPGELEGLSAMLEDYIGRLEKKGEDFDKLIEEQKQMLAVLEGREVWQEKNEASHAPVATTSHKGDFSSSTLLWTELQRKRHLEKELKEKKREVALLQAMASEQDKKVGKTASSRGSEQSADVTMATWGGSTQISAESVHDQSREAQSDSESFPGLARHQVNVGRSRRVRQWPDDQQYLPGKKKKRLVEHKSPVLKEEPRVSESGGTGLFGTSGGYSAAWPSVIFPDKETPSKLPRPTADASVLHSDQPAMSRQQEEDIEWEHRCQKLHQQLLQNTTLCNNLLREQLALSQLIQDSGSRPRWYVQEYMRRLQESSVLFNQQQQEVTRLQLELSHLYSLKQRDAGEETSGVTETVNMPPPMTPLAHPYSPFHFPWFNPMCTYSPWGNPYAGHYNPGFYPGYLHPVGNVSGQSRGLPGAFPSTLSQELPSTTQTVYPTGMEDEVKSNGTYTVDVALDNVTLGNEKPVVGDDIHSSTSSLDVGVNYDDGQTKATAVASLTARKFMKSNDVGRSLARKARKAALNEVKGKSKGSSNDAIVSVSKMVDTLSLSSAQSSVPGDGGVEESDYSLFEALRESIYAEVAALISQNESRPHFLIELFRELQLLSSDYLRQRALYAIQDLVTRYLTANSDHQFSTVEANILDSYFQPWLASASASEHTPSENANEQDQDEEEEEEEEAVAAAAARAKRYQESGVLALALNACSPEVYDYQEKAESASSLTTPQSPDEHPFAKDTLGDSVIRYQQPFRQSKQVMSKSTKGGIPSGLSIDNDSDVEIPQIDTQSLDHQIKSIITEVIPVLKDRMDEVCTPQLLAYIQALVLTLMQDKEEKEGSSQSYVSQFGTSIQKSLAKFTGQKMSECGEELLVELSEVLFNEMAFLRLMQEIRQRPKLASADENEKEESDSSLPDLSHPQPVEREPSPDDFTFSDGGGKESGMLPQSEDPTPHRQLQQEEEDLGKARDDALAVSCNFPSRQDSASSTPEGQPVMESEVGVITTRDETHESTATVEPVEIVEIAFSDLVANDINTLGEDRGHHEGTGNGHSDVTVSGQEPVSIVGDNSGVLESREEVSVSSDASSTTTVLHAVEQTAEETVEKYAAEQAEHEGISAVIKEVESQPELVGDDDKLPEPTAEEETPNEGD
ncbi:pericentriolar material 1 protein-like isoform X2 [Corticium candelabrum]|uniref:pericentriolar material 1 protein-like isoform X2 n=1 Tax=Corticium candelabrum TaxID=121492 RepID=UPI002E273FE3|nr:pericentriolar material 1 protein-like isoform X2 [Corticium candelabrum]